MIKVSAKVETSIVEVSAIMIAAGTAGLTAVAALPKEIQIPAAAVCAGLVTAGTTLLGVWHKFVNVLQETQAANTPSG